MLIVVRHGRTAANALGLLQGRSNHPIDEVGRRQAAAIAGAIGPVDRVVSSPLLRCRQTAEAFGDEIEVEPDFIELAYGEWEDRPIRDVPPDAWQAWRHDLDFAPPEGESLRQLGTRVARGLDRLAPAATESDIVVVTHVSPIKSAATWALGVDELVTWRLWVGQASISRISVGPNGRHLASFNETAHLDE